MRFWCGFLLLGLLSIPPVYAQFSGRVTGAVTDTSGANVPNAVVELYLAGGKKPLLSVKTSADGVYNFSGVRAAYYDLTVEAPGFMKTTVHGISVDPARETAVAEIKLALAAVTQSVEVSAQLQGVETSNAEISGTISAEEISNLPLLDRYALFALQTQPGVVSNGNSNTVINGLRTSYSDVTLDGINIQDNYIRDNALDYTPNKLLLGQVRQVTMVSANGNAAMSGGANQTAFSTPSGTNQFHGGALWENRNSAFSSNDWFNNQAGIGIPFLNQNHFGATAGGPIIKDKLFFYANYEAIRAHQQTPQNTTILTADARNGIFTYNDAGGATHKVNLLTARGATIAIDPAIQTLMNQVPGAAQINNFDVGDGRNTAGYRFNMRDNEIIDNFTGRVDYSVSTRQSVSASYLWNRDNSDRPDCENDFSVVPKCTNPVHTGFLAASWRWTPSARLTNEVRAGFNLNYADFLTSQTFGPYILTGLTFSDPVNEALPQGRNTKTFVLSDDASYQRGRHYIQFGFHGQQVRVRSYDDAGTIPAYSLAMGSGQKGLTTRDLPGVSSDDLATANSLLATLGGYIDGYTQTVNVTSRTSGFVPGAPYVRHDGLGNYGVYVQDKWKPAPRLTLAIGLRYEMPGVVDERDSLQLTPVLTGSAVSTLLSNATLIFAGSSAGHPWYNRNWKDLAPNFGLAWDVFGDGKTALRGGYSINYVNDQEILAPEQMLLLNGGLQATASQTGLSNRVSTGVPPIVLPTYQVPTTVANDYTTNPFNTVAMVDPNLRRPRVQQYSFGLQHEYKQTVFEARYVGNHVTGGYRGFDFNQVDLQTSGFLADFERAQQNGLLSLAAGRAYNPAYSALVPGSQPLSVLTKFGRTALTDPNAINYLQTGQAAALAYYYQTNGFNANDQVPVFKTTIATEADLLTNYSSSSYNSLQLEARHRMRSGLSLEANYTFSKVLSDADGDVQSRVQYFLDINNPKLERSRANFDLTHMIKADGFYDLPLGKGHRAHFQPLDRVIDGWTLGSIMVWESGAPFSILSGFGTLNRISRSYYNTAVTSLTGPQLNNIVKFQMTGNGPEMIASSAINPADGTGTNSFDTTPFPGEVFSNPGAGALGTLQRRMFSGPWTFELDMMLRKTVKINETQGIELRMDAINAPNHPAFWSGDQSINTQTFGVIGYMFNSPRVLELGVHYTF